MQSQYGAGIRTPFSTPLKKYAISIWSWCLYFPQKICNLNMELVSLLPTENMQSNIELVSIFPQKICNLNMDLVSVLPSEYMQSQYGAGVCTPLRKYAISIWSWCLYSPQKICNLNIELVSVLPPENMKSQYGAGVCTPLRKYAISLWSWCLYSPLKICNLNTKLVSLLLTVPFNYLSAVCCGT